MTQCDDPLRFLNIKRKRQQNKKHTPHKKLTQKSLSQSSQLFLPSFTSLNSMEQNPKITYNPFKYFSEQIENFLNNENAQEKQMTFAKDKQKIGNLNKEINHLEMMTFSRENKRKLFEQFDRDAQYQKIENNFARANKDFEQQKPSESQIKEVRRKNIQIQQFKIFGNEAEHEPGNQQLKQCQICSRKFNPTSYEKHVRICDRVFKQKRKPFRSRSTSLQANSVRKK